MKQLLILSGKGGTGKTTVASAFIELGKIHAYADCDVDAPNLHLVVSQACTPTKTDYFGFGKAVIDSSKCIHCGLCEQNCTFGAIENEVVGIFECEGCGVCEAVCPVEAIKLSDYASGDLMLYEAENQLFSTAQLKMGSGASGKLVTAVKKQLPPKMADDEIVIIDGSPGIGCPVIASISGVDMILIVAEPTISGIHDMKRIIDTAKHFNVKCIVCINKFNVNLDNTEKIEKYCAELEIPLIGKIPFDGAVVKAVNSCNSIACYPESMAAIALSEIWNKIRATLV